MGYSYGAGAGFTLDALQAKFRHENSGNTFTTDGGKTQYFHERGREQSDGAATGTVWKMLENGMARKAGSYRIESDGQVTRFPGVPAKYFEELEAESAKRYKERFGIV
jgi:hypothetical protein